MKQRWILKSRTSKTSQNLPAPQLGTPALHGPPRCSPWLVPSTTKTSVPEKTQLNVAMSWVMLSIVAPTSPKSRPISSLPLARPHFGKYTCASSANRSRRLPPSEVTPPLSKALRYSSATDFRCSSVIVPVTIVMLFLSLPFSSGSQMRCVLAPRGFGRRDRNEVQDAIPDVVQLGNANVGGGAPPTGDTGIRPDQHAAALLHPHRRAGSP